MVKKKKNKSHKQVVREYQSVEHEYGKDGKCTICGHPKDESDVEQ